MKGAKRADKRQAKLQQIATTVPALFLLIMNKDIFFDQRK
jgi:hypothetical protein